VFAGSATTLGGQNTNPILNMTINGTSGNITVRNFTYQNGLGESPSLSIATAFSTGTIRVENSLFRGNNATGIDAVVSVTIWASFIFSTTP
jgi:hypothetical protein